MKVKSALVTLVVASTLGLSACAVVPAGPGYYQPYAGVWVPPARVYVGPGPYYYRGYGYGYRGYWR
jgi:hypothetical protein